MKLTNLEEEVQSHDIDISNLDETMTTLQASMSDLEDTVETVEDSMTVLETENNEIQQRLTVLEETVIGMLIYSAIDKAAVQRSASGWNDPRDRSNCQPHSQFKRFSGIVPGKVMEWPGTVRLLAL